MKFILVTLVSLFLTGCGSTPTSTTVPVDADKEWLDRAQRIMKEEEENSRKRFAYKVETPKPPPPRPVPPAAGFWPAPQLPHSGPKLYAPGASNSSNEPKGSGPSITQPNIEITEKKDVVFKNLFKASLAFVTRETANINEDIKAQLLIDPSKTTETLVKDLTVKGSVISNQVNVSRIVKATLVAPDFVVTNITDEEQILSDVNTTEWLWKLTPKNAGTYEVNLSVSAIIKLDNKESKHHIKTFDKTITIIVTKEQIFMLWIKENYKWLVTTFLIPLVIFAFKEKFKKLLKLG